MYYRSSATVTRDGILQTDSSRNTGTNALVNPTESDTSTRISTKQLRSQLDEHLSDLRSKERSFFPSSLPNISVSETPIISGLSPPGSTVQYQIHPNFVNTQQNTQLQRFPNYRVGDSNADLYLINSAPQHTLQQNNSQFINSTDIPADSHQCENTLFTNYSLTEQYTEPMFLSPLSNCYYPTHSESPAFQLFGAESNESTVSPDTAVSQYSDELGIFSNEN